MYKRIVYIVSLLLVLVFSQLTAQEDDRQYYEEAKKAYDIGRLDKAIELLGERVPSFSGTLQTSAYRLLAMCYLEQDEKNKASEYVDLLLQADPYYSTSLNDSERFVELVKSRQDRKMTLITASMQVETIEDAPVPVTLITEEMIQAIGATNLQQVLAAYVPGVSIIEGNTYNIAMRGAYSSSQEQILIMLNGHRLNGHGTNSEAPDFRHSLDKIKQIEVLRGPASSLYGNVALTAVINIITKSGVEVNGLQSSVGMGDNSTYKADLLFGKRMMNLDLLAWASAYSSRGEKRMIPYSSSDFIGVIPIDGYAYLGGFNNKPSYDFGLNMQWGKLKFLFNQQHSKRVIPYTSSAYNPTIYSYDKYRVFNGTKPGHSRLSTHGEISYADKKGNWSWNVNAYLDAEKQINYDISGDTLNADDAKLYIADIKGEYYKDSFLIQTTGVYQILEWEDISYGFSANGGWDYALGDKQKGHLLFGVQIEGYDMRYSSFALGDEFDRIDLTYSDRNTRLLPGKESTYSAFVQIKHQISPKLIFNGGTRFDYKRRATFDNICAVSPRVSLIYKANAKWNLKTSYARSFVDAPYFYRANQSKAYSAYGLTSEYLDALQLSAVVNLVPNLTYEGNLFYNKYTNMVYYATDLHTHLSGNMKTIGIEHVLSYTRPSDHHPFMAQWNGSYLYSIEEPMSLSGHKVYDVPSFISNLVCQWKAFSKQEHSIWLRGNISAQTKQLSSIGKLVDYYEYSVPARALVNMGVVYKWKDVKLDVQCFNLLNTHYSQGSSLGYLVPQQGRNFLAKVVYVFH